MAKTKSERMKEYRARKKATLGESWLQQESERVRKYYRPVKELNRKEKSERRSKVRKYVKDFRERQRKEDESQSQPSTSRPTLIGEDENGVSSTSSATPLIVKFPNHKSAGKKRVSRALMKAYRELKKEKLKNESLTKSVKKIQKRLERSKRASLTNPTTPKSKVDKFLRESGLSPKNVKPIRKRLLFAECLVEEVKTAKDENKAHSKNICKIISGRITKKYKMLNVLKERMKIVRGNYKLRADDKSISMVKRIRDRKEKEEVRRFLERDDNSRMMPGKADAVKTGTKQKTQKRILNDYLHNLYLKFTSESNSKVAFKTFCKYRPKYIYLVNFNSRSICLCSKHQNFAMKLKCLKNLNIVSITSPDKFVESYRESIDHIFSNFSEEKDISYKEWKKVKLPNGDERLRVVDTTVSKAEFVKLMGEEFRNFIEHTDKIKSQYSAFKTMKEKLPKNHALVHMDFSENYTCKHLEEVQSAYFSSTQVTIHPTVVYFINTENPPVLKHVSTVFVSDVLRHNATMVFSIIKKLVSSLVDKIPDLNYVHFWTDSPTSQYRNKTIFDIVCRFEELFHMKSSWHYFEAGHGKGACDGIGGTTKRNADMAVVKDSVVIQDATDFYAWAVSNSQSLINYSFVSQNDYDSCQEELKERINETKAIKGTMNIHAIFGISGHIMTRSTTCMCSDCFGNDGFNCNSKCSWKSHEMVKNRTLQTTLTESAHETNNQENLVNLHDETEVYNIEDFVIAEYEGRKFIGKVTDLDEKDGEVEVTFMEACGKVEGKFKWPIREDKIWIPNSDIKSRIPEPIPTGKTKRLYSLPDEILALMID